MAFSLVSWTDENRLSIIPSSWVVEPPAVESEALPISGKAYWKKKSNVLDVEILAVAGGVCNA